MIKKSLILIVFACSLNGMLQGQDNVIDGIIWVIGDEAILLSDVEEQRSILQTMGERFQGDPYCFIPEQIAIQKLFLNQAKIDSIEVDEGRVIQHVDLWIRSATDYYGSREKLEEYLKMPLSQIREKRKTMVREQQTVQQMQEHLTGDIKLTPAEVRRYFQNISPDSLPTMPTTVEVQIVMFEPVIPVEDIDAIKARLREYTDQVHSGERDFASLARRYSEDDPVIAMRGGELGMQNKGLFVPEFANVAFNLTDPRRVSNIVETEYGFHIIQLIAKQGDRINVRQILLRPRASDQALDAAIARMDTLYRDITAGKLTFEEAATYLSFDKDTKNNKGLMVNHNDEGNNAGTPKFEMQELPPEIAKIVDNMQVGEISAPFVMKKEPQQKEVIAIVKLKARTQSHRANLIDDYQELKTMAEGRKKEDLLRDWIAKRQKTIYVRIAEGWRNCDFQYPGWIR